MLIAMGSASELEYHLLLAHDLGYLDTRNYQRLSQEAEEVKRMLSTLITKVRPTNTRSDKLTSRPQGDVLRSEGVSLSVLTRRL
jgi:hypothetical protein